MQDPSPEAQRVYFDLLRAATPQERLEISLSLSVAVRNLALAGIKAAHPGQILSDDQLRQALAERLYGSDVAQRVFGARNR